MDAPPYFAYLDILCFNPHRLNLGNLHRLFYIERHTIRLVAY